MTERGPSYDPDRSYGVIITRSPQSDGLSSLMRLILNYHCGLDTMVAPSPREAASLVAMYGDAIRCSIVLPDREVSPAQAAQLSQGGQALLLIHKDGRAADALADLPNVHAVAHGASGPAASDLPSRLVQILAQAGLEQIHPGAGQASPAMQNRAVRLVRDLDTLPTLPQVVLQIMRMMADPTSSVTDLERLLMNDPAIVHKLIQVVNSPLFAPSGAERDWSLRDAVVRIGWREVASIAQQVALMSSFAIPQGGGFDLKRFWVHSLGCAVIADRLHNSGLLSLKRKLDFNDYWIAGLLHDMGKLTLGCFFQGYFEEILAVQKREETSFREAETVCGGAVADHEYIGRLMVLRARMTPAMAEAVGAHHTGGRNMRPLTCLIHLADSVCKDLGLGYLPGETGACHPAVLPVLGLSSAEASRLSGSLGPSPERDIEHLAGLCMSA